MTAAQTACFHDFGYHWLCVKCGVSKEDLPKPEPKKEKR